MKEIINKIQQVGGNIYLVGGAVRDEIIGKEKHDEDYCVTGISYEEFIKIFPNAHMRGKDFPVFDIEGKEITLARRERKIGIGHKGFEIETNKEITIEQDLERRDITINAIAKNLITGEIIDPFGGIEDIKNKKIKATSKKFAEDPLRVYRVARFGAQLKFDVEINTIKLMGKLVPELNTISKERVFEELRKALKTEKPSIFFEILKKANALQIHFKEINDLIGVKYNLEADAYNHTMEIIDKVSKQTEKLEIRYAALVHELGKGITFKEIYPHNYEINSAKLVEEISNRIGVPNSWKKCGKTSAKEYMLGEKFWKMLPAKQVEFLERIDKSILGLEGLQIIIDANNIQNKKFSNLKEPILEKINGEYIKEKYNIKEGIKIREKLREERVKEIKKLNKKSNLVNNLY